MKKLLKKTLMSVFLILGCISVPFIFILPTYLYVLYGYKIALLYVIVFTVAGGTYMSWDSK